MAGLGETVALNLSRKNEDLRLYELGTTHHADSLPLTSHPVEVTWLCGAMVGRREGTEWCHSREMVDFYDAKGVVESLLGGLGVANCSVQPAAAAWLHPGKQAELTVNGICVATVGALHPAVQEAFGISRPVYVFKVNLSELGSLDLATSQPHAAIPKFPAISRNG